MAVLNLASAFCQICWVVRDIEAAEKFFIETIGVRKFMHFDHIAASETEGTYRDKPGDWAIKLYIAYAGDTQIELIQHLSGSSMYEEFLQQHGNGVQHVAYWLDESEYDAAERHLESSGFPLIQGFKLPVARVGYFDTRAAIGVVTEIIGATPQGHILRRILKDGHF